MGRRKRSYVATEHERVERMTGGLGREAIRVCSGRGGARKGRGRGLRRRVQVVAQAVTRIGVDERGSGRLLVVTIRFFLSLMELARTSKLVRVGERTTRAAVVWGRRLGAHGARFGGLDRITVDAKRHDTGEALVRASGEYEAKEQTKSVDEGNPEHAEASQRLRMSRRLVSSA